MDDSFRPLTRFRSLDMSHCFQDTITDDAFRHWTNSPSLDMTFGNNKRSQRIHLSNFQSLGMSHCYQRTMCISSFDEFMVFGNDKAAVIKKRSRITPFNACREFAVVNFDGMQSRYYHGRCVSTFDEFAIFGYA